MNRRYQPIAQPYIVAPHLYPISSDWLSARIHQFAHHLVLLNVGFNEKPGPGLLLLRSCVNLERLGVLCDADLARDLHEVLDLPRFFPRLEQLALCHFDAPRTTSRRKAGDEVVPYIPPRRLTHLSLCLIGGTKPVSLLLKALDPSHLRCLSSLEVDGLGNTASFVLIEAFQATLVELSYDMDVTEPSVDYRLLSNSPFPAIRRITLSMVPHLPAVDMASALQKRASNFRKKRGEPLRLERLVVVMRRDGDHEDLIDSLQRLDTRHESLLRNDAGNNDLAAMGHHALCARILSIWLMQYFKAFEVDREDLELIPSRPLGLGEFGTMTILVKGRALRRTFGEEDEE